MTDIFSDEAEILDHGSFSTRSIIVSVVMVFYLDRELLREGEAVFSWWFDTHGVDSGDWGHT